MDTLHQETLEKIMNIYDCHLHSRLSFDSREGDKLYFSRWYEDPDYREEVVVRHFPHGEIRELIPGVLMEMPDGQKWILG